MAAVIPESHRYLLEDPIYVTFTTVMPNSQPQSTVVWCDYDGEVIRINSAKGRQKDKNVRANPRVTVLAIDPQDPYFWIEVRGTIEEITEQGAVEHIDSLARMYSNFDRYFGGYAPEEQRSIQTRVIYKIRPTHVVTRGTR